MVEADQQRAHDVTKEHGRFEKRSIVTATLLNDYLKDWPGIAQVFWIRRERRIKGKTTIDDVYGITSLDRSQADAKDLLAYNRSHWSIENRLHHVRDVTFGEDACRVRQGSSPELLAGLRNAALTLLRQLKIPSVADAIRACAFRPKTALRLLIRRIAS